ncbi:MAG TPA: hypothetical protein VFN45_08670 [Myxococcaceae bacterium]|nr:hypothetical protein [Myxococcaceae bacterium]
MSTRRWSARSPWLFWVLALLTTSGVSRAAAEPCKLLTSAQVAAALGGAFGAGQPIGSTGCSWSSDKPHVIVTVSLWPPAEWDRIKSNPMPGTTTTPASGVGDDAFYATIAQYVVLYVKKGQTVYLFKVYGVKDSAKQMSAEKTLALDALQKL